MEKNHEMVELGNRDCNRSASPSSSSMYHSTRMEGLLQSKTDYETALDFEIAASKDHWSEFERPLSVVSESPTAEENWKAHLTNLKTMLSLQRQFLRSGNFFQCTPSSLVLGQKIAEGAQAEIFEAKMSSLPDFPMALKVFKEGSSVLDLQKQWPQGMLHRCANTYNPSFGCSPILFGMMLTNGRFAFVMFRYPGDLRKLIDKRIGRNGNRFCPPFSDEELQWNMHCIAEGMKGLHKDNIVHRDLKASNVLIYSKEGRQLQDLDSPLPLGAFACQVADYECSVGVVGTAFWRAPEILQAVKGRKITLDLFTKEADVYSFAMTCYEMITGRLPFEGLKKNNYDVVLRGERPTLPEETQPWIKALLSRCWHSDPKERPSFEEISKCIVDPRMKDDCNFEEILKCIVEPTLKDECN